MFSDATAPRRESGTDRSAAGPGAVASLVTGGVTWSGGGTACLPGVLREHTGVRTCPSWEWGRLLADGDTGQDALA